MIFSICARFSPTREEHDVRNMTPSVLKHLINQSSIIERDLSVTLFSEDLGGTIKKKSSPRYFSGLNCIAQMG